MMVRLLALLGLAALVALPAGATEIRNANSNKLLAVSGGSMRNGGNVIQWRDVNQRDASWRIEGPRTGTVKIRNSKSGLYLAVAGGGTRNGTNVIQWRDVKQPDIRWRLQPAGRCYKIYNINSRKYLAVSGGSRFDGANVTIWEDTGKRTQRGIIWCLQ